MTIPETIHIAFFMLPPLRGNMRTRSLAQLDAEDANEVEGREEIPGLKIETWGTQYGTA
jgi:hypothetical protein